MQWTVGLDARALCLRLDTRFRRADCSLGWSGMSTPSSSDHSTICTVWFLYFVRLACVGRLVTIPRTVLPYKYALPRLPGYLLT